MSPWPATLTGPLCSLLSIPPVFGAVFPTVVGIVTISNFLPFPKFSHALSYLSHGLSVSKNYWVCRFPQLANGLTSFSSSTSPGTENRSLSVRLTFSPWFYTLTSPSLPLRYWPLLHHWLSLCYPLWHLHLNMPVIPVPRWKSLNSNL